MQTTPKNPIADKFVKGIADLFRQHHQERGEAIGSLLPTIDNYLFCVTTSFCKYSVDIQKNQNSAPNWTKGRPTAMRSFGLMQFEINKFLFEKHLERKNPYQPLTFAAVDFEGSRAGKWYEEHGTRNNDIHDSPHIHALSLVHPNTLEKFMEVVACPHRYMTEQMDGVTIENFDPQKGSMENWIQYSVKGALQNLKNDCGDYWNVFPQ
mgnify:CR=1 FL=1